MACIRGVTVKSSVDAPPVAKRANGSNNNFANGSGNLLSTVGDDCSLRTPVITESTSNTELSASRENTGAPLVSAVIIVYPCLFSVRVQEQILVRS